MTDDDRPLEHTYPCRHRPGPGQHWASNTAWEILDRMPPGLIPLIFRARLAGLITAALIKVAEDGAPDIDLESEPQ